MDIKKLAPWNWFKKEEEATTKMVPVRHTERQGAQPPFYSPVSQLHREIDRLFENFFRGFDLSPFGVSSPWVPGMGDELLKPTLDIAASDKEYTITVEIPGVDEKDVKLELVEDTLTIRGEKRQEKEENEKDFYRMERSYGAFQRVLSLPEDADQDRIQAAFKKGVLTVSIPRKSVPASGGKRIEIKTTG
ncbi:MAG: Hsp20/alpha crystallin family protein [Deltaproteobacteria bacterium]|nr:Hsp20/alpha crystallin family protein [Deltaproteobacteria bacterium]MBW1955079.1 Hsp20/alpha crystallin family protein [Deltaproteobacteria bacterium]MBW2042754.1 Hsp20/alpha crystallin family protein [Deltaproteobacteria bacterium]MBW2133145.1 Hsp20/alpha crystallin family protein [Deltaproteobacteria bacterium]